jgi:hypothetical protein
LLLAQSAYSQEVKVELGPDQVASNQLWTITITVENERLKNYSPFPEIEGLVKRGTSSSTSTSFVNGRMTSSQSIIQNYLPAREGRIRIPTFKITVNDEVYEIPGKEIIVGPAQQRRQQRVDPFDPFQDLFNRNQSTQEFVDVEADAFLALTTDKNEVYVGEGFTTTLAFYVSESNRADMRFYDLGTQITEIVKKIKPENCWEENFNIENINGEPVQIRGKAYTQYKIFQATYYPLNSEDIFFPSVGLTLIKYKRAKNPSFFGVNRKEDYETFYAKEKRMTIKELPPHPLMDRVAVGNYRLQEKISAETLQTGQSFNYQFTITGEGNISSVEAPVIPRNEIFDFYEPNIQQNIRRSSNTVRGNKSFDYYGIPNEPGNYELGDYIQWVFFDPLKENYDTIRSNVVVNVEGESRKNVYISSNDLGSFYDGIVFENNELKLINNSSWFQIIANIMILMVLAMTAMVLFKK